MSKELQTLTRWQDPTIKKQQKEIDHLKSIIKEVREYVKENITSYRKVELLEILDRENK